MKSLIVNGLFIILLFSCKVYKEEAITSGIQNFEQNNIVPDVNIQKNPRYIEKINQILNKYDLQKENMTAQDYNVAGMFFYEKQLWEEAELMFYKALEIDEKHILANYNLACVLSIRYNDNIEPNEVFSRLQNEVYYYLLYSIVLDPSRRSKARNDSDFENIKRKDVLIFDTITLEENERPIYKYDAVFKESISFEGEIDVVFIYGNDELWLDGRDEKIKKLNLYSISENSIVAYAIDNEEKVGNKYKIEIVYIPESYGFTKLAHINSKIISIEEL